MLHGGSFTCFNFYFVYYLDHLKLNKCITIMVIFLLIKTNLEGSSVLTTNSLFVSLYALPVDSRSGFEYVGKTLSLQYSKVVIVTPEVPFIRPYLNFFSYFTACVSYLISLFCPNGDQHRSEAFWIYVS